MYFLRKFAQLVDNITTLNSWRQDLFSSKLGLCAILCAEHTGIAQLVEHRSPKPGVGGSNPSARAILRPLGGRFFITSH